MSALPLWPQAAPDSTSTSAPAAARNAAAPVRSVVAPARGADARNADARSYQAALDSNETLFSVLAAINSCGYDDNLETSDPLRAAIRAQVSKSVAASPGAQAAQKEFCGFYKDHEQGDSAHNIAQYISLALMVSGPPDLAPLVRESDLPPDVGFVLGSLPLLRNFYRTAGLAQIWEQRRPDYEKLIERYHDAVAEMIFNTDIYLRLQMSGYLGRSFIIYVEPLLAPGVVNARNYGDDYYVVISPEQGGLNMQAIRHTYLHYVLDPYALNHGTSIKRLQPLLYSVETAPMDQSFKRDIGLLVTESLIRAIEARTLPGRGEAAERARDAQVDGAEREGYVLTRHFYEALEQFEKGPAGLKDSYGDWIYTIDLDAAQRHARNIEFAKTASPELVYASKPREGLLDGAERRLMAHDAAGAAKLAQQALQEKREDAGRAFFILARAAAESGDMAGAETYFQRALDTAHEARLIAWSHIYLGRILDIKEQREAALAQYRAALSAGDVAADTKSAAERGLAQPYAAPAHAQNDPQ